MSDDEYTHVSLGSSNEETVSPRYKHGDVMTESKPMNAAGNTTQLYPAQVGDHTIQVEYTYKKLHGVQRLVKIKYTCTDCGSETGFRNGQLYKEDKELMRLLRGWMHGFFIETDCL